MFYFISYRAIYLETRHSFICFELRIVSMGFKWDHQQSLMRIYWNFMESGIWDIEIWLKFWVSGSNELGKIWEEGNVVPFVKMSRDGIKLRKRVSKIWRRLSSIYSNLLLPPLSNDRFLIDLLTGRDYLSAFDKRFQEALHWEARTTELARLSRSHQTQSQYKASFCKVLVPSVIC